MADVFHEELAEALEGGFGLEARMVHYRTGETYEVFNHVTITDNSEHDGHLGICYTAVTGPAEDRNFCRPWSQVSERFTLVRKGLP